MDGGGPNTSEAIYQLLKNEILDLTLAPGRRMSEQELCARFGVSRTPVRTALQRLKAQGLVDILPYKGCTVTLLDFDDICQMIYMRIAVETAVLRDFIPVCTPMLLERIRYQIRMQKVLVSSGVEAAKFYEMDSQMHYIWFKATGKQRLWEMIQRAEVHYTRFRMLDIVEAQNFEAILAEHTQLFRLLQSGDAAGVGPLMHRHLNGGVQRLGDRIVREFGDYFIAPGDKNETRSV